MRQNETARWFSSGMILVLAALLNPFVAQRAMAATYYWDTDGAVAGFGDKAGTWGVDSFWSTSSAGTSATANSIITTADTINFGSSSLALGANAANINVSGIVNVNQIKVGGAQANSLTLSGGTIALGGTSPVIAPGIAAVINSDIALSANAQFNGPTNGIGGTVTTLSLNGSITGGFNVTFYGALANNNYAQVFLGAQSSYTGATLLNCVGTGANIALKLGADNALPTSTVLTFDGGNGSGTAAGRFVRLDLNGCNQTLSGITTVTRGARRDQCIVNSTGVGYATLTVSNAASYTFRGQLGTGGNGFASGPNFGLTKDGAGKLTLNPANTNSSGTIINLQYSGATTINNGILEIAGAGQLGNGNYATNIFIASGAALLFSGTSDTALSGPIDGGGSLTNAGTGTLIISGTNTLANTVIASGSVIAMNGGVISALEINDGGTLNLPGTAGGIVTNLTFDGNGVMNFDVANGGVITCPVANGIKNNGSVGSVTVNITGAVPAFGNYNLINYSGSLLGSGFSAYQLGATPGGANYTLTNTGSAAQLMVAPTPVIITAQPAPTNLLVAVGTNVSYSVSVTGGAPIFYQWRKNGSPLTNGANISGATTVTLNLSNVPVAVSGIYDVVVSNAAPSSATSIAVTLSVFSSLPVANFNADKTAGLVPLTVNFTNLSTNASSYLWNFGDGSTSTNPSPTYSYTNGGSFSVTLTAFNIGNSNSLTRTNYISVTNLFARPFIWVRDYERPEILAKISSNSWAASLFNSLVSREASSLASYQSNRDTWLRGLPVDWTVSPAKFLTMLANANPQVNPQVRGQAESKFNDALDCAILYYLTQDTNYAQCAADTLHNTVRTLAPVAYSSSVGDGGWIIQDYWNLECRVLAQQLPIIYDLVYPYIRSNQVYDVQTAGMVNFNFVNAQTVFTNYYVLARDHGDANDNWCSLEATAMLNNLLALDNATTRSNFLTVYLTTGASRQTSLSADHARDFDKPGEIWNESMQYSSAVGTIRANNMVLIERYDPSRKLLNVYSNYLFSLPRHAQLVFPNKTEQILFGDGNRGNVVVQPYSLYEQIYALSKARGYTNWSAMFGGLINGGVSAGSYSRSSLSDYDTLGSHNEPLKLLWSYPTITESPVALTYPRSDALPWAGISLQRNFSPKNDSDYDLMCFVGGAAHVHSHASGMNMELYGCGYVLGSKSGRDAYSAAIHNNYYRLFSAANTIVVNAGSQGSGGWQGIAINTVQNVAMEPQPFASAVSSNFSFTCSSFADNMGSLAEATQQRTMAIIRTSPTNGFYVDIFRSISAISNRVATTLNGNVTNQFHDYIYRNVGSASAMTLKTNGVALGLSSQPNRFQNDIGDTYNQPGWLYFTNQGVSYPQSQLTQVHFAANPGDGINRDTEMFVAAVTNREFAKVDSPPFSEWVDDTAPGPTVVIRQIGEAWNKPFAVVYEPYFLTAGYTVRNVTAIWRTNVVVGLKIESQVAGKNMTHYVFSNTNSTDTYTDNSLGLTFTGRFGIVADDAQGSVSLYLGQGQKLSYRGNSVTVNGGTNSQAEARFNAGQTIGITANAPVTTVAAKAPNFTQIMRQPNGVVSLTALGTNAVPYRLWSCTNLAKGTWTMLNSGSVTNSPFTISDSSASNKPTLFYRFTSP